MGVLALAVTAGAGCSGGSDDAAKASGPTASEQAASTEPAPNIVQPGAPGEDSEELSPEELDDIEIPTHTAADVEFMQDMIHHHMQAIRMARLVPARAVGRDLPLFAKRLRLSQEAELDLMARWLQKRGEQAFGVHDESNVMPGMLTEAEFEALENATGRDFNRLFLNGMIRHHRGALTMVARLNRVEGAGFEPELAAFAREVESDQSIEINRMLRLLAKIRRQDDS